jgi:hypothetical protein
VGKPVMTGYRFHRFWTKFKKKIACLKLERVVTLLKSKVLPRTGHKVPEGE